MSFGYIMSYMKRTFSVLFLISIFMIGCGKPPKPTEELYWPKAPLTPKIKYVETIYGQGNLKRSFWGKVSDFFFGKGINHRIGKPYGITYDGYSKLFIADTSKKGILVFNFEKGTSTFFNELGNTGTLAEPVYIKLDKAGNVYVSDTKLKRVAVFTSEYISFLIILVRIQIL